MTDLKNICDILTTKANVRGKPVAISLFHDTIPEGYEPIDSEPCTVIRCAMDEGRKVYFDADHHDCLVGAYHSGMMPGKKEIMTGEYLSMTSSFFTYEGAARLKAGCRNLPLGFARAIGAAPLDQVPAGVNVNWIVCVCNAHNANMIAACRVIQDGVQPYGGFGTSLCGEIFATPWHERNVVITFGDFGGRMYNRLKQDQLFVVIPIEYANNLSKLFVDFHLDPKATLEMTKPPGSKYFKKNPKKGTPATAPSEADGSQPSPYTMAWDDRARDILKKVPEGIMDFVIENAETFARSKGYDRVTESSLAEQMEEMGMSLDEMLDQQ